MFRVAVKHIDSRRDLRIALGSAIRFSKPGMATLILRKDKSIVNFPDDNGSNPLQAAACEGNIQMVRFLIESGADVRKQDRRGDLPIHCAVNHVY
ncbi:MAG: ankyrin repeat domain-containing protein, partial [Planctomycetes bacterium]|nr:ankyrin repeat domain-containing protein [Planctomycetota bacterium]